MADIKRFRLGKRLERLELVIPTLHVGDLCFLSRITIKGKETFAVADDRGGRQFPVILFEGPLTRCIDWLELVEMGARYMRKYNERVAKRYAPGYVWSHMLLFTVRMAADLATAIRGQAPDELASQQLAWLRLVGRADELRAMKRNIGGPEDPLAWQKFKLAVRRMQEEYDELIK